MIETIQQILKEYSPTLNTRVGSVVYHFIIIPILQLYNWLNGLISSINTELRPENFGIAHIEGRKGTGIITVTLTDSQYQYTFPQGTLFETSLGDQIEVTQTSVLIAPSGDLNVQTVENTSKIYSVGTYFIPRIYISSITNCVVKSSISGGTEGETDEEWRARIIENLSLNTMTIGGIKRKLKETFPEIIDVVYSNSKLLIKCPLESKTITITNQKIYDIIAKISSSTETITSDTIRFQNEEREEHIIESEITPNTITYLSPIRFKEIAQYCRDTTIFPLGWSIKVKHADIIWVTMDNCPTDFILEYPIKALPRYEIYNQLRQYTLPYSIKFNNIELEDGYEGLGAYYDNG